MRNHKRRASIRLLKLAIVGALLFFVWFVACGDGDADDDDDDDNGDDTYYAADDDSYYGDDDAADDDDDAADDDDDSAPTPPPEPEADLDPGTRPRQCGGAVFVLNTEDDFVTRIDVADLTVHTIAVGNQPEVLRATDDCAAVLTLNTGDDTVSIINTSTNAVRTVGVRPGLNALATAPGGRFALAYHDFATEGGAAAYGEVSIVRVPRREVSSLAIGFPPDHVVFTPDERVLLVSEITLALVDLDAASFTSVPTGLDIDAGQRLRKVAVTADGKSAFLLAEGASTLRAVNLRRMTTRDVELGCYPTDLDVAESGAVSLAVCREEGRMIVIDNTTLDLSTFETEEVVGSGELTPDGSQAVLFTSASAIERVHVMTTADGNCATHLTVKPVIGAAIAPDGRAAVLFQKGGDFDPVDDFDRYFDTRPAFSILGLNDGRLNPIETPELPESVAFSDDGAYGLVPLPNHRQVALADLRTGLTDMIVTPSRPLDAGVVSSLGVAYILQDHPLGRISFYDIARQQTRTITGFVLNGRIEP